MPSLHGGLAQQRNECLTKREFLSWACAYLGPRTRIRKKTLFEFMRNASCRRGKRRRHKNVLTASISRDDSTTKLGIEHKIKLTATQRIYFSFFLNRAVVQNYEIWQIAKFGELVSLNVTCQPQNERRESLLELQKRWIIAPNKRQNVCNNVVKLDATTRFFHFASIMFYASSRSLFTFQFFRNGTVETWDAMWQSTRKKECSLPSRQLCASLIYCVPRCKKTINIWFFAATIVECNLEKPAKNLKEE